jgi:hypothetical protein
MDPTQLPIIGGLFPSGNQQQPQQPDASVASATADKIAASLGTTVMGSTATPDTVSGGKTTSHAGWTTYTFQNGSTIDIDTSGNITNYIPSTQANQAANAAQPGKTATDIAAQGGILFGPGGQVYVKNPTPDDGRGAYIPSTQTLGTQQLSDAKTVADTQYQQAQANKLQIDNAIAADPTNQALQQQKAQSDIAYQQAQMQKLSLDAAVSQQNANTSAQNAATSQATGLGNLAIAQQKAPGEIAYTGAQTASAYQNAATGAGNLQIAQQKTPGEIALTGAQTQAQLANAAATQAKIGEPTLLQTGTTSPTTSYWDPTTQSIQTIQNPGYLPTDPGRMIQQLQGQAQQQQQALQQQVQAGKITADQASSQFDQWWNTNVEPMKGDIANLQATQQADLAQKQAQAQYQQAQTAYEQFLPGYQSASLAQTASDAAQRNAIAMMPYTVGPGFSQAFSQAVGGIGSRNFPSINPSSLANAATYSLPNLQEIGRQGAAAALANISPTAQMHLNTPGPVAQSPVSGLPDMGSLLNQGAYSFGAPGGGGMPGSGMGGAPGGGQPPAGGVPQGGGPGGIDWAALRQRLDQDTALQQVQAGIWGQYQPTG